jgi:hypothetical protein
MDMLNDIHVWGRDNAGNISDAASVQVLVLDPDTDYDKDGLLTRDEEIAGTDAGRHGSVFHVNMPQSGNLPGGARVVVIRWASTAGRIYSLYSRESLLDGMWQPVAGHTNLPGTGEELFYVDTRESRARWYRVTVRKQED